MAHLQQYSNDGTVLFSLPPPLVSTILSRSADDAETKGAMAVCWRSVSWKWKWKPMRINDDSASAHRRPFTRSSGARAGLPPLAASFRSASLSTRDFSEPPEGGCLWALRRSASARDSTARLHFWRVCWSESARARPGNPQPRRRFGCGRGSSLPPGQASKQTNRQTTERPNERPTNWRLGER